MASQNPAAPPSTARLIRSVLVVMGGFMLTKGVSLIQTFIIADRFGAGAEYDSFATAMLLPDYIVRLIGGGAIGVAFIPMFTAMLSSENREGAWRLASQALNTIFVLALGLAVLVMIFAQPLVEHVIAPGLSDDSSRLAAEMMRILAASSVLFCVSGLVSGVLHGHNHFFLPVLAPVFQDLGLLFGVIFFVESAGIHGLAWGVLLGAVLHLGIQIPGLIAYRFRWQALLGWNDPTLRRMVGLMLPRMLIAITFIADLLIITRINSRLGEGAISAFSWAMRFIDIPQALIGTAVGIVIFPTLSALTAAQRVEERRAAFSAVMRFIIVASIPATVGLLMVAYDALRLINFDETDAAIIFTSIQVMSAAILIQSLHEILTRAFYAEQDTRTPFILAVIASIITIATVWGMFALYQAEKPPLWSPLAVGGPALGYVMTFLVEVVLLWVLLRRRWGDLDLGHIVSTARRTLAASLAMAAAVLMADILLRGAGFDGYTKVHLIIRMGLKVGVGGIVFLAVAWALRVEEIRLLPRLIRQRGQVGEAT